MGTGPCFCLAPSFLGIAGYSVRSDALILSLLFRHHSGHAVWRGLIARTARLSSYSHHTYRLTPHVRDFYLLSFPRLATASPPTSPRLTNSCRFVCFVPCCLDANQRQQSHLLPWHHAASSLPVAALPAASPVPCCLVVTGCSLPASSPHAPMHYGPHSNHGRSHVTCRWRGGGAPAHPQRWPPWDVRRRGGNHYVVAIHSWRCCSIMWQMLQHSFPSCCN
jgi:hypothetical protein